MKRHTLFSLFLLLPTCAFSAELASYQALDLEGRSVSLIQGSGRLWLVNVWATWCEPCLQELPELEAIHQEFSSAGLVTIGLSVDVSEAGSEVSRIAREENLTYRILRDPQEKILRILEITSLPCTVLVDSKGKILHRWNRPFLPAHSQETNSILHKFLKEPLNQR